MPEVLAKLAQGFAGLAKKAGTAVATGQTQAGLGLQSPHLAGAFVRVGRFLYIATAGWIGVSWYTGYVNERTAPGSGPKFVLPGMNNGVISTPDRPDKSWQDVLGKVAPGAGAKNAAAVTPAGPTAGAGAAPGTDKSGKGRTLVTIGPGDVQGGMAGYLWVSPKKEIPAYDATTYRSLIPVATAIANQFGLHITSSFREPRTGGSLHNRGLAFDMVGTMTNMKRAASYAAQSPGIFQEIFIHDAGSGLHVHLGFYADGASIYGAAHDRYNKANSSQSPAPAQSRAPGQWV